MKILLALGLMLSVSAHADLSISQSQVDSLKFPFSLEQLTYQLSDQLAEIDRPLFIKRRWEIILHYYGMVAAQKELILLRKSGANIRAIHNLNLAQQKKADVSDTDVLNSHNRLLSQELSILRKQEDIRTHILSILRLTNVEIDHGKDHKEVAQDSDTD